MAGRRTRKAGSGTLVKGRSGDGPGDRSAATPLFQQMGDILRDQIATGVFDGDAKVPSEHELAERFGVSRITAKRALDELAAEGLVSRRRGYGTTVIRRFSESAVDANIHGLLDNLLMFDIKTKVRLIEYGYNLPTEEVRRALRLEPGAKVLRVVRMREYAGQPLAHTLAHLPEPIARLLKREDLKERPIVALLEKSGILVGSAEQTITAANADTAMASRLGVAAGAPLFVRGAHDLRSGRTGFATYPRPLPGRSLPLHHESVAGEGCGAPAVDIGGGKKGLRGGVSRRDPGLGISYSRADPNACYALCSE